MIEHYVKSGFRYFLRSGLYSTLNIIGLVLGMSASALLFIYVWDELRHDQFHSKAKSIYRLISTQQDGAVSVLTPGPLAPAVLSKYSNVDAAVRVGKWSGVLQYRDKTFEEFEVYFADHSFFDVFDFTVLAGDRKALLTEPNHIVLTEKTAEKFFGVAWREADVLGATITMNKSDLFQVVGVLKNPPSYSSIQFDYLLSFQYIAADKWNYQWNSHNFHTYVLLQPGADVQQFQQQIRDDFKSDGFSKDFHLMLQPLENIYLESFPGYDWGRHGQPEYVIAFSVIGFLILLVACFNYINLATSRATRRAKEIAVRKLNGARRFQLFLQFMGESFLLVLFSALLSRAVVDLLLPTFNEVSGKNFLIADFQVELAIVFIGLTLLTSFLAGVYPAIVLSGFQPLNAIKGTSIFSSASRFRPVLVSAQFAVALLLIIVTAMIQTQLDFIRHKDLGFDNQQLVSIRLNGSLVGNNEAFKEDISQLNYVRGVSRATTTLVNTDNGSYIEWPGKREGEEITISQLNADEDFIPTLKIKLVAGRNFVATDSAAYILNESAIRAMGYTAQNALGTKVKFWGTEGEVIGVVQDFHFRPLHHAITPLIVRHNTKENFFQLLVKVDERALATAPQDFTSIFKKYEQTVPFTYRIVEEAIVQEYQREQRVSKVMILFSGLAIIISLLGVLGMVAYTVEQRAKEFSIRRVLGSSFSDLLKLLSRKFVVAYLAALLVAAPLAYLLILQWLENFNYKAPVNPAAFLFSFVLVALLALLIILVQAWQHMRKNTLECLRSE